jgi:hypothetical protein
MLAMGLCLDFPANASLCSIPAAIPAEQRVRTCTVADRLIYEEIFFNSDFIDFQCASTGCAAK